MSKIITKNQLIGDIGEHLSAYVLSSTLQVIYRPISRRDTGVDAEIELTEKIDDKKFKATGTFIKVQVKSSTKKNFNNGELIISLNDNDINYFTSDLNLPGILTYVDLKNPDPKVYWAEIIPTKITKNNNVVIKESNVISKETIKEIKRIESYYRSIKFREELIYYFETTIEIILSHIKNVENGEGLAYVLSEYSDDIIYIRNIYEMSYSKNMKKQDIPEYEDIFGDALAFTNRIKEFKESANKILKEKGLKDFDSYVKMCE